MHGRIRWLASGVPKKAPARDLRMPTSPAWGRTKHESDGGRDRPVSPPPDRAQAPREPSGKVSRVEYIIEDEETCGAGGIEQPSGGPVVGSTARPSTLPEVGRGPGRSASA